MNAPRVSILVPATSTTALLRGCLDSLSAHVPEALGYEVIVVLNKAGEDLSREYPTVRFVPSPVNLGLAGAGNRARALARGELLVVLHDDAQALPGWLESLISTAEAHPEAGAIGGKVLFPDGRLQNAGAIVWSDGSTSMPWPGQAPEPESFAELRAVDYCGTSSLLIRASVWDQVEGLDEQFYPVYYVDVDLAMAVRALGMVVLYQPESRILHHKGGSGRSEDWRQFVTARNRVRLLQKWGPALLQHEPADPSSAEAIVRALARAEQVHLRARPAVVGGGKAGQFDASSQQRRLASRELALEQAYTEHVSRMG